MWDLIVSVPDHCLSFYFKESKVHPNLLLTSRLSISRLNNNLYQSSCTTIHNSEIGVTGFG